MNNKSVELTVKRVTLRSGAGPLPSVSFNRAKVFSFEEFTSEPDECESGDEISRVHQPRCAFIEITEMLPSPSIAVSSEIFYKNEETLCKYFGVVYRCRRRLGKQATARLQ